MTPDIISKIQDRSAKVVVVGQGYVGLPLAMAAVEAGYSVVGLEKSTERVSMLKEGLSYIGDVSNSTVEKALKSGFLPTTDLDCCENFDVAIISVPTPLSAGVPDLSFVESASRDLAKVIRPGACVILESTTFPGTTEELVLPLLLSGSGLPHGSILVGYSPERIDPGNFSYSFHTTPKIVSGVDEASFLAVDEFFRSIVAETIAVGSCREAELAKLLENTFRHVNIALVNELARFAQQLDINIWNVIDAAATKPFGFMKFSPGPGVGGHCLPVDPSYLSWSVSEKLGESFRFIELANDINDHMPQYVLSRLRRMLANAGKSLPGAKVLVLGLAYKEDTSDWRESPSVTLIEILGASGASTQVCDPLVAPTLTRSLGASLVDFTPDALRSADLVVVMVGHAVFDRAVIAQESRLVFDARNVLRGFEFTGECL